MINKYKHRAVADVKHFYDPKIKGRIVHVKTTPFRDGIRHFYWNTKTFCFVNTPKANFPVESVFSSVEYKCSCLDLNRKEIQIGDSVIYIIPDRQNPFVCATVTGIFRRKKKVWLWLEPSRGNKSSFKAHFVRYRSKRFHLVSNNLHPRKFAASNVIDAMYQDEIDKLEALISRVVSPYLFHYFFPDNIEELTHEKALRIIHRGILGFIYKWAGYYRDEEIVVTNREHPTMKYNDVPKSMADFFVMFSRQLKAAGRDRERLIPIIAAAHWKLAWIHPFQDGNGRAIRLYLDFIALSKGLNVDSQFLESKKRYYHVAVRKAIRSKGTDKNLITLIEKVVR
jgi:cell filamentation protein